MQNLRTNLSVQAILAWGPSYSELLVFAAFDHPFLVLLLVSVWLHVLFSKIFIFIFSLLLVLCAGFVSGFSLLFFVTWPLLNSAAPTCLLTSLTTHCMLRLFAFYCFSGRLLDEFFCYFTFWPLSCSWFFSTFCLNVLH